MELCSHSACFIPEGLIILVLGISSPFFRFGNGSFEFVCEEPTGAVPEAEEVAVDVSDEPVEVVAVFVSESPTEVELGDETDGSGFTNV